MSKIEGIESDEWFRRAAERQGTSNKFARYDEDTKKAVATRPKGPSSPPPKPAIKMAAAPAPKPEAPKPPAKQLQVAKAAPKPQPSPEPQPEPKKESKPEPKWKVLLADTVRDARQSVERQRSFDERAKAEGERFNREEAARAERAKQARKEEREAAPPIAKAISGVAGAGVSLANLLESQRLNLREGMEKGTTALMEGGKKILVGDVKGRRRAREKLRQQ